MKDSLKNYLITACQKLLAPVIRILLKAGVTHKDFSELSKAVYVQVAREDYGVQGRKTNMARVAILTGLSRKECLRVRRLTEESQQTSELPFTPNPAARVVAAWASEPDFVTPSGEPKVLPSHGTGASMETLFQRFAGDIPGGALLKELFRIGAVSETEAGLKLVNRTFIPKGFDQDRIRILATQLSDLGNTIYYNLVSQKQPRLQRYVVNDRALSAAAIKKFQSLATEQAQALLEQLDAYLSDADEPEQSQPTTTRVGVGVYYFEEPVSPGGD